MDHTDLQPMGHTLTVSNSKIKVIENSLLGLLIQSDISRLKHQLRLESIRHARLICSKFDVLESYSGAE